MTDRLRLVHVIPNLGTGGAERMLLNLLCALDPRRVDASVLSLYPAAGSIIESELHRGGVRSYYLSKRPGPDPSCAIAVWRTLRELRPDVVHTHRFALSYVLPSLVKREIACVHTVHNIARQEVPALHRVAYRFAFRLGVAPVAISAEVARSFELLYRRPPAALIPIGIPLAAMASPSMDRRAWRASEGVPDDAVVFVCVARFAPQKNLHLLIDAFARTTVALPTAILLLAGDGPLLTSVQNQAGALGIRDRVRFLGERRDMPSLLGASDVFVLSSDWEGTPVSIMEAMAAGLPVAATAVGGVPELVRSGTTGRLARPKDARSLGDAMLELGSDATLRRAMGLAASRLASEALDVRVMASAYENLYCRLSGRAIDRQT
ncbi:glycosyltransferase [Anaeromyxobacter soli]|uniref:glycosyltransferase n=1 Tax=Anaeromyxobacter soli TaxID=2922725 RepID=UPI001FAE78BA|nr:glycosyltransferase [Anaeromyxobacter sp. SG29]